MGEGTDLFIMDSKGTVISSYDSNKIEVGTTYSDSKLVEKVVSKQNEKNAEGTATQATFDMTINKQKHLVAFSSILKSDWYIVSTIPYSYLTKETNGIGVKIMFLIILCVLIAMLMSVVISNSISDPLKKMVEIMKEQKAETFH